MNNDYLGSAGEPLRRAIEAANHTAVKSVQKQMEQISKNIDSQLAIPASTLEAVKVAQGKFAADALKIVRDANLRFDEQFANVASQLAGTHLEIVWQSAGRPEYFNNLFAQVYPKNLRGIKALEFDAAAEITLGEGIPLYGAPRMEVAARLLGGATFEQRLEILREEASLIREDCIGLLDRCKGGQVEPFARAARHSIEARDAGNHYAAQALAATVIDTIKRKTFGHAHYKFGPDKKGKRTTESYDDLDLGQFLAFSPIWAAYRQFHAENDDPIPPAFNRHACAHSVSETQFNETNSIHAILFACSLVGYCDEDPDCLTIEDRTKGEPNA